MSILDSQIAPVLILVAVFGVLLGFFRKTLLKVLVIILAEAVFFALFPSVLQKFVNLILAIRRSL